MKTIEQEILNALLDKYERSKSYCSGEKTSRRIMLKLHSGKGGSELSLYNINDHDSRVEVNDAIVQLKNKGLIGFDWLRGDENHIIEKAWLNYDSLGMVYVEADRQPKADSIQRITSEAANIRIGLKSEWAQNYFDAVLGKSESKRDFGSLIPEIERDRIDLWKIIQFVDGNFESEIMERVLSVKLFSDSKRYEKGVRSNLLSVLRKFLDTDKEFESEDELSRQVGIVKYPERFEFCGELLFVTDNGKINFGALKHGSSLCSKDLKIGRVMLANHVNCVISIENYTNYMNYITNKRHTELIIYHGGQYSPQRKMFFEAIRNAMHTECVWQHWGDIDYGGFSMLLRLRKEISADIKPLKMGIRELEQYKDYCGNFTMEYENKLRQLADKEELRDCVECLKHMIESNIRLEQESLLLTIDECQH